MPANSPNRYFRLRELDVSHLDGLWAKPVTSLTHVACFKCAALSLLQMDCADTPLQCQPAVCMRFGACSW